jgi:6-phosphogluconolactonase
MKNVEVLPSAESVMRAAADYFAARASEAIAESGRFAVALSGGNTPRGTYALLASDPYAARIAWKHVHFFWSDERCVPPDDVASNYRMACDTLLDRVPVPAANVHRIAGESTPDAAAADYESELRRFFTAAHGPPPSAPGRSFDLVFLGMGDDGHTASLFPGTAAVRENRRWVVAHHVDKLAAWRITLTPPVINSARNVVFLVSGAEKAAALRRAVNGAHDPDAVPAQAVAPREGRLQWLVDATAAAELHRS